MKTISRIAIGAVAVMLVAATLQPAQAACATPRLLDNVGAYLVSNPNWGGAGATRTCGSGYGCYASESAPPISAQIAGVFWGFDSTTGTSASDPAYQAGIDNGSWGVSNWTKSRQADFAETYYYAAWLTLDTPGEPNSVAGSPANWSFPVDGCPNDIDPDSCTCIMLTDQWDGLGYFMVDSAITEAGGDFLYSFSTTDAAGAQSMQMIETPLPEVTVSNRNLETGDVTMTIAVADITGTSADYRDNGCDCGLGFVVYQQKVGRAGLAPVDRSIASGWTPALDVTGGVQAPTPFAAGATADIIVDCDPAVQEDTYLATAIVEPGGLVGANVSGNSFRIECGANLADPERPDRGNRGRSADAPRGRGENRGQRDR